MNTLKSKEFTAEEVYNLIIENPKTERFRWIDTDGENTQDCQVIVLGDVIIGVDSVDGFDFLDEEPADLRAGGSYITESEFQKQAA